MLVHIVQAIRYLFSVLRQPISCYSLCTQYAPFFLISICVFDHNIHTWLEVIPFSTCAVHITQEEVPCKLVLGS